MDGRWTDFLAIVNRQDLASQNWGQNMRKALFVTTISGTMRAFLLPFVDFFRANGWTVDGMAAGIDSCQKCKQSFSQTLDINWTRNPFGLHNLLLAPRRVRQIVEAQHYDLVHVHTPVASFVTRFALRKQRHGKRPKIIYTAHGFHFYDGNNLLKNIFFLNLEKLAGRWTDYLVVMNEEDRHAAWQHKIVPPERVIYMPGIGVDTQALDQAINKNDASNQIRNELGIGPEDKILLMIAEFIPRKCHFDALRALAKLERSDVHLVCAGKGPLEGHIRKASERLGLKSQIHFLGFRNDIPLLIRAADALILPSTQEGLPRSLMEALCLSTPCVASNIRGNRELLSGGCGKLFSVHDIQGFSEAIAWVLNHPDEAVEMGARGRIKMQDYDLKVILKMHEDLYDCVPKT
jgi:glycosyltransferase involved in cell wall biosynthesis